MLERPDFPDEVLIAALQAEYGLRVTQLEFLPLGVDVNAAVYRVEVAGRAPAFLKVRRGPFDPTSVLLPSLLHDQSISQIIAPCPTHTGARWVTRGNLTLILYPFVAGHDGYTVRLSDDHWRTFGAAMRRVHTASLPPDLVAQIPQERYSDHWCDAVRGWMAQLANPPVNDAVARELAAFLQSKQGEVLALLARTEALAAQLRAAPPPLTVCHSDLHAGNILIGLDDALYIVDWDAPIRAPKERDLMFPGGGQFGAQRTPAEEERLFYAGYGPTEIHADARSYYRYVRIVEDIALFCAQVFLGAEGGEDRAQAVTYVKYNFLPTGTLAAAYRGDETKS